MGNACNNSTELQSNSHKGKSLQGSMLDGRKPRLTDFIKLRQLGKGAYGIVYLVKHQVKDRYFAMKVIKKSFVRKESTVRHLQEERKVLERVNSPWLVKLKYAFQDSDNLYLIVNYMAGGELFYHLRHQHHFSPDVAKFYAAELLMGLKDLHGLSIIYRDMKPENILLSTKGHLKLADFGLSKVVLKDEKAHSLCGTPEYLAPEVLTSKDGYNMTCDFYSYGCIVYEMHVGHPPFFNRDKAKMIQDRLNKPIEFPSHLDEITKDFLKSLLQRNPRNRLGDNGVSEVMQHPYFDNISFADLRSAKPPYNFDKRNFKFFEQSQNEHQEIPHSNNLPIHNMQFPNFTYEGQPTQNRTIEATEIEI